MRSFNPLLLNKAKPAGEGRLIIPEPRFEMPELMIPGKKPRGNVVIVAPYDFTFFYLLRENGGVVVNDTARNINGTILSASAPNDYYSWTPEGILNTTDPGGLDNEIIHIDAGRTMNISSGFIMGWSEIYTGGNFNNDAWGIGDYYENKGAYGISLGKNNFVRLDTDTVKATIGGVSLDASDTRSIGNRMLTYSCACWSDGAYNHAYIFKNGRLLGSSDSLLNSTSVGDTSWGIGRHIVGLGSQGLNALVLGAFLIERTHDLNFARNLSANPYQFLEPA